MQKHLASRIIFCILTMLVYLDNCVFNRPFDDQSQTRIKAETKAVLKLLEKINLGQIELVWSYMSEFEMSRNPFPRIRESIVEWKDLATVYIDPSLSILEVSYDLRELGLKQVDSLHISSAVAAKADYFISTDDGILSKLKVFGNLAIQDPVTFISKMEGE